MVGKICAEIRNYFLRHGTDDIYKGSFTVSNGAMELLPFLQSGQYFRIVGSVFNDGVHKVGDTNLTDEVFDGEVWAMAVPPDIVELADQITEWLTTNADALSGPYQSESFGGYNYSLKSGTSKNGRNGAFGWKDQFASSLNPYRRLSVL